MTGVVVGVDSSTQSCKVLVVDAETGETVASGSAPHPDGTAVDPRAWLAALRAAWGAAGVADRSDVLGVGVAGQQHGLVALDEENEPVHHALLWNDLRSAPQAGAMADDLGTGGWLAAVNLLPLPAITLTKLAWLREERPQAAERVKRVMLPHDWLIMQLTGAFCTDPSDASGTGYFSAATGSYRTDLLARYFGKIPDLPRVLAPDEAAGRLLPEWGKPVPVSAGLGDNAGAGLGLEIEPGEVVVSVGTSGTVFSRSPRPISDPSGATAGFASASGDHLPLLCTLNAARVLTTTAQLLGRGLAKFDALAQEAPSDAGGLVMLPYFDGERTPNLPDATGQLHGLTRASFNPPNLARAAVLSVANSLADCVDLLGGGGVAIERVLLIGGGSRSAALRAALADTLNMAVSVPEPREYVALGAARQALWAVSGTLPRWGRPVEETRVPSPDPGAARYRERYVRLRSWLTAQAS